MSTHRNGLLVRPDFNWIFEADIRRLTESISAQNGRDVFVYVNWHDRNGVEFLRKWIRNYPINSNIKERFG